MSSRASSAKLIASSGQAFTAVPAASSAMISRARIACVRVAASALARSASRRARIEATVRGDSVLASSMRSVQRLGRRLRVAGAGEFPRGIARLDPQAPSRPRRETAPAGAGSPASASSPCGSHEPQPRRACPGPRAPRAPRPARRGRWPGAPHRPQHPDAPQVSRPCEGSMTPALSQSTGRKPARADASVAPETAARRHFRDGQCIVPFPSRSALAT